MEEPQYEPVYRSQPTIVYRDPPVVEYEEPVYYEERTPSPVYEEVN